MSTPATRRVRGHASIFGVRNDRGEIFLPGAFADSCALVAAGAPLPFFYVHGHSDGWGDRQTGIDAVPIGVVDVLAEDDVGLYFEAQLVPAAENAIADAALAALSIGALRGMSICFERDGAIREDLDQGGIFTRIMHRVALAELSIVSLFGSDRLAYVELIPATTPDPEPPAGDSSAVPPPASAGEG